MKTQDKTIRTDIEVVQEAKSESKSKLFRDAASKELRRLKNRFLENKYPRSKEL